MLAADSVSVQQRFRRSRAWNLSNGEFDDLRGVSDGIQNGVAQPALFVMILNDDHLSPGLFR